MVVQNESEVTEFVKNMDTEMLEDCPKKYMDHFLQKKEANGKWIEYWVVCRGNFLLFYTHKCEVSELRDSFRGSIELTPGSKCIVGKRKKYSFPFFLSTSKARYYFKSPTLLLRHQWIHAIGLAVAGSPPELPPRVLPIPSSQDSGTSQSDDDMLQDDFYSKESTEELVKETALSSEDYSDDQTDSATHIIQVRARSPNSNQVTNFLSGERRKDGSNFQVTDFLNARNAETTRIPKIGIDNLSFEEEECVSSKANTMKWQNDDCLESMNSGTNTPKVTLSPIFSRISQPTRSVDSPRRIIHSAGSIRGSSSEFRGSTTGTSIAHLSLNTNSSSLSLNSNRFSRHLVNSAPDLKIVASG